MPKKALKAIEPPADELDAALTAASAADKQLADAEIAFNAKYPGDHRLLDLRQDWEPEKIAFSEDRGNLITLRKEAYAARRAVELAQARADRAPENVRRSELATAIEAVKTTEETVTKLRAAVARADGAVAEAEKIQREAAATVVAATEAHAKTFEAAIEQGHPPGRDNTLVDARRQADAAADDLATARTAAGALRTRLKNAVDDLTDARTAVGMAVGFVVNVNLPRLLEDARALQLELEGKRVILDELRKHATPEREAEIEDYLSDIVFPYGRDGESTEDHPAAAPWLAAIQALHDDADAPLPSQAVGVQS